MTPPTRRRYRPRQPQRRRGDDRGSVTLELAILAPALIALLGLAIVGGRYQAAAGAVEAASAAAARSASLARTPAGAEQAARATAAATAANQDLHCQDLTVTVDVSAFRPATTLPAAVTGPPAQVAVTVTCRLDLAQLAVPGAPGAWTVSSRSTSVLDTFRATS